MTSGLLSAHVSLARLALFITPTASSGAVSMSNPGQVSRVLWKELSRIWRTQYHTWPAPARGLWVLLTLLSPAAGGAHPCAYRHILALRVVTQIPGRDVTPL